MVSLLQEAAVDRVCPWCELPAWRVTARQRYVRGDKNLVVDVEMWQCANGCESPRNGGVYTFTDAEMDEENRVRAGEKWRARFGEWMPRLRSRAIRSRP